MSDEVVDGGNDEKDREPPEGEEDGEIAPGQRLNVIAQVTHAHGDEAQAEEQVGEIADCQL